MKPIKLFKLDSVKRTHDVQTGISYYDTIYINIDYDNLIQTETIITVKSYPNSNILISGTESEIKHYYKIEQ